MIVVKTIDHVVLRTDCLPAMLEFYSGLLGCAVERELPDLGLVQLRAGAALIDLVPVDSELGRRGGEAPGQSGHNMDHVCLLIEAVAESALLQYLQQRDVPVEDFAKRYGATGFGRSIYLHDPQGNVVELKLSEPATS